MTKYRKKPASRSQVAKTPVSRSQHIVRSLLLNRKLQKRQYLDRNRPLRSLLLDRKLRKRQYLDRNRPLRSLLLDRKLRRRQYLYRNLRNRQYLESVRKKPASRSQLVNILSWLVTLLHINPIHQILNPKPLNPKRLNPKRLNP